MTGFPDSSSCSLPKATSEPQKEIEPTIAANMLKIATYVATPSNPPEVRNSTHAMSATAPPPTPLKSATIWGIWVIFTLRAAGIPTTVPSTMPSAISGA